MKANLSSNAEFYNAIRNKEIVFLFGTGISSALTGKPYGWWKWIVDGISSLKDKTFAKSLMDELENDESTTNMISVVGKLISAAKGDGSYAHWMHNAFERNKIVNVQLTETLQKLVRAQTVFTTTNYDRLLEEATGLNAISYENPDKAFSMLDKRLSTSVIHIHGIYDSVRGVDNIIADNQQYANIIDNQGAQFIQGVLGTRTLVFVGCGKTTEDANISRFIQFANRHLKMDQQYFFLQNSKKPVEGLPTNILPVSYGDDYDDLPLFLEDIAQERLKKRIEENLIVGLNPYEDAPKVSNSLLKYHFSHRYIPYCGRGEELSALMTFVVQNASFSWWAVTGQAASGKSRLALELLYALPTAWMGFFLKDDARQADIDSFNPFCNTLIVIDYVAGRERIIAEAMCRLKERFSAVPYQLRILLIEREGNKNSGSWYAKLIQRLNRTDAEEIKQAEYADAFLNLQDMNRTDVEAFIAAVCISKGLNEKNAAELYETYGRKYERLRFRPLYLQLFVEAWADNDCTVPQYESYAQLLEYVLQREQERWMAAVDGDYTVCNSFLRLMMRANITGSLDTNEIPELYKRDWDVIKAYLHSHSFAGKQREAIQDSLINSFCQNVDREHALIAPQFPDIIKEYMFAYYADENFLPMMMKEIWQDAASAFSTFIRRCMMDFPDHPFFMDVLNSYQVSSSDFDVLAGRLEMLRTPLIQKGEDPQVFWDIIDNEYAYWSNLQVPDDQSEQADLLASMKVAGLYRVAQNVGAWSLYDLTEMEDVIDEMLAVKGGKGIDIIKKHFLQDHLTVLSTHGFLEEAEKIRNKLKAMIDNSEDEFDSLLQMQSYNDAMMTKLLTGNVRDAKAIFHEMTEKCNYSEPRSVRMLAHSCFNIEQIAMMSGEDRITGLGDSVAKKCEVLYPQDGSIRARRIGCDTVLLQKKAFAREIEEEETRRRITELENEISTMSFNGSESDEALEMTWGSLKSLKINFADEAELGKMADEADGILAQNLHYTTVAATRIMITRALHHKFLKTKIPHDEVERLYKLLEENPESESIRNEFFDMLDESVDAGNRRNYFNQHIIREAINDAKYNPMSGSGIPEIEAMYGDGMLAQRPVKRPQKVGRNDPCPCGSGRKFKKCCLGKGIFD